MIDLDALYEFSPADWADLSQGTSREWLVANGLGSYASSTLIGANTRRYHGLFVAALDPPIDRWLLLSKVEEELGCGGKIYQLSTNQYRDVVHPEGYSWLTRVATYPFPTFLYHINGIILKKELFMPYGKQITVIRYELLRAHIPVSLYFHLLVTARPFHNLLRANSRAFVIDAMPQKMAMRVRGRESLDNSKVDGLPGHSVTENGANLERKRSEGEALWVASDRGYFYPDGQWCYNFQYIREKERGLDFEEDIYRPGCFTAKLREGESVALVASLEQIKQLDIETWRDETLSRIASIRKYVHGIGDSIVAFKQSDKTPDVKNENVLLRAVETLALAADTFVVQRASMNSVSILAGYPWFSEWGRDTFIALPGLALVLGRFEEARAIFRTFGQYCNRGLIPNSFLENASRNPIYNSVDASLWFINAIYEYWRYTHDTAFIKEVFGLVCGIILAYETGTAYGIHMAENGLLLAGDPKVQLTWMDAKVGPWVVTPRYGAAVEINALWYNALCIAEALAEIAGLTKEERHTFSTKAERIKATFLTHFRNSSERCLYDCLQPKEDGGFNIDASIRPNQIFAVSLPFSMLSSDQGRDVLERVWKDLYTPYGLRTLAPSHQSYRGQYQGDRWLRDGAYHQGTVWPWLLGPFITAYLNVYGRTERTVKVAEELLAPVLSHLWDGGVGTISEIFGGDFPHTPAGAVSQAWSVAEVLRVLVEKIIGYMPDKI